MRPFVAAGLSAVAPGAGHWYAGRRLRAVLLFGPLALLLVALALIASDVSQLLHLALEPRVLWSVLAINTLLLALRAFAVVDAYRVAGGTSRGRPLAGLVAIVTVVAAPHVVVTGYGLDAVDTLETVFASAPPASAEDRVAQLLADGVTLEELGPVAIAPEPRAPDVAAEVWRRLPPDDLGEVVAPNLRPPAPHFDGNMPATNVIDGDRITVLLAGGDAGPGRSGLRTDTMIVATIDRATGEAALFALPRNLARVPLPPAFSRAFLELEHRFAVLEVEQAAAEMAARAAAHGDDGDAAALPPPDVPSVDEIEPCDCYVDQLNAIYPRTKNWVRTFPDAVDPGMEALRRTVAHLLDLRIDYYVLVDMAGFVNLVDALGGVDVYVDRPMHIAFSAAEEGGPKPTINVAEGRHRLDGLEALAFVRSRHGTSDYTRMARQRCMLASVAAAANPGAMLLHFKEISAAVRSSTTTNIPLDALPELVTAAARLSADDIALVAFQPPTYSSGWDFLNRPIPNVGAMRAEVRRVLSGDLSNGRSGSVENVCEPDA